MTKHTLRTEAGREADKDFHSTLLEATGNPFMITLSSGISAAVAWTTVFKHRRTPLRRDAIPDHRRVFECIKAGDPVAARKAMDDLVQLAFQDTRPAPAWAG